MIRSGATWLVFAIAVSLCTLVETTLAQAVSPLTKKNHPFLCVESNAGDQYVSPLRLYSTILAQAGIPGIILDKAAAQGISLEQATLDQQFPPASLLPSAAGLLKDMRNTKNLIVQNFAGEIYSTDYRKEGYIRDDTPQVPEAFVFDIYDDGVTFAIRCVTPAAESDAAKRVNEFLSKALSGFRLRKDMHELTLVAAAPTAGNLKERLEGLNSAKLASLSIAHDYEKDSKNIAAEGAIGYQTVRFLPFVAYQFQNRKGSKEDIEVVSPGIIYDRVFPDALGDPWIKVNVFAPIDLENDAQRFALETSLEPSFALGDNMITVGSYTAPFNGPIWILPTLGPLVEASHIFDAGTNAEFGQSDDFLGIGARAGLKMKVPQLPVLETATLSIDYEVLQLVAGDRSTFDMFEVSLGWTPKDVPHFGISVSYEVGENGLTFQDEEAFSVNLGARF